VREMGIVLHRVVLPAPVARNEAFQIFLREDAAGRTPNPAVAVAIGKSSSASVTTCTSGWPPGMPGQYASAKAQPLGRNSSGAHGQGSEILFHGVTQKLGKTPPPVSLGELRKAEVRKLAHAAGLPVYDKPAPPAFASRRAGRSRVPEP